MYHYNTSKNRSPIDVLLLTTNSRQAGDALVMPEPALKAVIKLSLCFKIYVYVHLYGFRYISNCWGSQECMGVGEYDKTLLVFSLLKTRENLILLSDLWVSNANYFGRLSILHPWAFLGFSRDTPQYTQVGQKRGLIVLLRLQARKLPAPHCFRNVQFLAEAFSENRSNILLLRISLTRWPLGVLQPAALCNLRG